MGVRVFDEAFRVRSEDSCSAFLIVRVRREIEEFLGCAARAAGSARRADGMDRGARSRFGEQSVEVAKVFLQFAELAGIGTRGDVVDGEGKLRLFLFQLRFEDLARAGDGVALAVEEALDAEGHLDVAAAIETLAGAAFVRFELRKLALPEAQDIGRDIAEPGDFADAEVKLVRDVRSGWVSGFADWLMLRHAQKTPMPLCRRRWPVFRLVPV